MNINFLSLDEASQAQGVVVVIDVLRAFTTAAYALADGAKEIILVGTVEEALAMKQRHPDWILMGEVGGLPIHGFDLGNSPSKLSPPHLAGRILVQRTSAGTQGVVRSQGATHMFAASLVCARATVEAVRHLDPQEVSFIITGSWRDDQGEEDRACADLMAAMLQGKPSDLQAAIQRVYASQAAQDFLSGDEPELPADDVMLATQVDWFDFAMPVIQREGLFIIEGLPER